VALLAAVVVFVATRSRQSTPVESRQQTPLHEEVLAKARPLVERGRYGTAIGLMRSYVSAHPGDVEVRPLLAEAQLAAGEVAKAQATLEQLLQLAPNHSRGLWLMGEVHRRQDKDDYVSFYKQAADAPDADARMWARYGAAMLERGEFDEAAEYLAKARQAGLTGAATALPLAELAARDGDWQRAEDLLGLGLRERPHDGRAWALLVEAMEKQGKLSEAAATAERALERIQPDDQPIVYMYLGRVQASRGLHAEAAEAFAKAARNRQLMPQAYFRAAQSAMEARQYQSAFQYASIAELAGESDEDVAALKARAQEAMQAESPTTVPATQPGADAGG
jgi:tetratricopeptide (TPR) repeat protein